MQLSGTSVARPTMGRDGNDFPRPRVRIYALDRMRGIEAKRDNAVKKKAKVGEGEGEGGGVVVRWRFSIDNQ